MDDIYRCFISGAKFGALVGILTMLVQVLIGP